MRLFQRFLSTRINHDNPASVAARNTTNAIEQQQGFYDAVICETVRIQLSNFKCVEYSLGIVNVPYFKLLWISQTQSGQEKYLHSWRTKRKWKPA